MLGYAADTFRGTALTHVRAKRQTPAMIATLSLLLIADLIIVTWNVGNIAGAPGHPLNYLLLAWSLLLVAYPISMLRRSGARTTTLIAISGTLAGTAISLWDAAQAPADWVNYFSAALLVLPLLALWLASRWARTRRA
jgi:hypothetical protein